MARKKMKRARTSQQRQPQWQPLGMLPTLAQHIDGMLEADIEQYTLLLEAQPRPATLDNTTVNRVIAAFTSQRDDFWLFEEQLKRWQRESLTSGQQQEVERLVGQMKKLRDNNAKVLDLARELAKGTIEMQLAKSDEQLGLEFLLKMRGGQ